MTALFLAVWRLLRPKPAATEETMPSVDYEQLQAMWKR